MALYSGLYLMFEGTDAQASATQRNRELTWVTNVGISGSLRYVDLNGAIHHIRDHSFESITSGYFPVADGITFRQSLLRFSGYSDKDGALFFHNHNGVFISNNYRFGLGGCYYNSDSNQWVMTSGDAPGLISGYSGYRFPIFFDFQEWDGHNIKWFLNTTHEDVTEGSNVQDYLEQLIELGTANDTGWSPSKRYVSVKTHLNIANSLSFGSGLNIPGAEPYVTPSSIYPFDYLAGLVYSSGSLINNVNSPDYTLYWQLDHSQGNPEKDQLMILRNSGNASSQVKIGENKWITISSGSYSSILYDQVNGKWFSSSFVFPSSICSLFSEGTNLVFDSIGLKLTDPNASDFYTQIKHNGEGLVITGNYYTSESDGGFVQFGGILPVTIRNNRAIGFNAIPDAGTTNWKYGSLGGYYAYALDASDGSFRIKTADSGNEGDPITWHTMMTFTSGYIGLEHSMTLTSWSHNDGGTTTGTAVVINDNYPFIFLIPTTAGKFYRLPNEDYGDASFSVSQGATCSIALAYPYSGVAYIGLGLDNLGRNLQVQLSGYHHVNFIYSNGKWLPNTGSTILVNYSG